MSTTCSDVSRGYQVTNPTAVKTLVAIDAEPKFEAITVFNDTDVDIQISYQSKGGDLCNFFVPKTGRVFTRYVKSGLLNNSLYIQAIGGPATGKVTFNLGN